MSVMGLHYSRIDVVQGAQSSCCAIELIHMCCVGWQAAFRAEGSDASAPLLGKPAAPGSAQSPDKENSKPKNETQTIKALLSMSAVDTPLLMLAFAAGNCMCVVRVEREVCGTHFSTSKGHQRHCSIIHNTALHAATNSMLHVKIGSKDILAYGCGSLPTLGT